MYLSSSGHSSVRQGRRPFRLTKDIIWCIIFHLSIRQLCCANRRIERELTVAPLSLSRRYHSMYRPSFLNFAAAHARRLYHFSYEHPSNHRHLDVTSYICHSSNIRAHYITRDNKHWQTWLKGRMNRWHQDCIAVSSIQFSQHYDYYHKTMPGPFSRARLSIYRKRFKVFGCRLVRLILVTPR